MAYTRGTVIKGMYRYSNQLLALDACKPKQGEEISKAERGVDHTPPSSCVGCETHRASGPHICQIHKYIVKGLREGFRMGFNRVSPLKSALFNLSVPHPGIIQEYIGYWQVGVAEQNGPILHQGSLHIGPMGMIPRKNRPGKWRLIVDLSSPKGKI